MTVRDSKMLVAIDKSSATYRLLSGPDIDLAHHGDKFTLTEAHRSPCRSRRSPCVSPPRPRRDASPTAVRCENLVVPDLGVTVSASGPLADPR